MLCDRDSVDAGDRAGVRPASVLLVVLDVSVRGLVMAGEVCAGVVDTAYGTRDDAWGSAYSHCRRTVVQLAHLGLVSSHFGDVVVSITAFMKLVVRVITRQTTVLSPMGGIRYGQALLQQTFMCLRLHSIQPFRDLRWPRRCMVGARLG